MKKSIDFLNFNTQKIIISKLLFKDDTQGFTHVPVLIEIDVDEGNLDFFLHGNPELKFTFSIEHIGDEDEEDDKSYYSITLHVESTSLSLCGAELQCILRPITRYL